MLGGGGGTDYKAGRISLSFAFCFKDSNPAPPVRRFTVEKAQVMLITRERRAGFSHAGKGKPLANRYPVRNGGNIDAGGKGNPSGGGVILRKRKGNMVTLRQFALSIGKGTA